MKKDRLNVEYQSLKGEIRIQRSIAGSFVGFTQPCRGSLDGQ